MKVQISLIILLFISATFLFYNQQQEQPLNFLESSTNSLEIEIYQKFVEFKQKFNRNYSDSTQEMAKFKTFYENYLFIKEQNQKNANLTLSYLTPFADMANQEYIQYTSKKNGKSQKIHKKENLKEKEENFAKKPQKNLKNTNEKYESINWVRKGAVTDAKTQGYCNASKSFAVAGALEGLRFIQEGILESLSAQQLTFCPEHAFGEGGCLGNTFEKLYGYASETGLESDYDYPYTSYFEPLLDICEEDLSEIIFKSKGMKEVEPFDGLAMNQALLQNPVSIAIDTTSLSFQFYQGGILTQDYCNTGFFKPDQYGLLVGYDEKTNVWLFKNSWGVDWGEDGFAQIANEPGLIQGEGTCGIFYEGYIPY